MPNGNPSTTSSFLSPNHPNNLRKQAKTQLDPSFSVKSYIGAANALLEKARSSDAQGQAEQAFVNYLKAADVAANIPKHADWHQTVEQRGPTYFRYQDFMKNVPDIIQRGHRLEELLKAREEARAREAQNAIQDEKVSGKPFVEQDLEGAVGGTDAVTDQQAAEDTPSAQFDSLTSRLDALRVSGTNGRDRMSSADARRDSTSRLELGEDAKHRDIPKLRSESGRLDISGGQNQGFGGMASPQLEKSGFAGISDGFTVGPDMQPTHLPSTSDFSKSYPTLDDFEAKHPRPESPARPLPVPPTTATKPKPAQRPPLPPPVKRDVTVEDLFAILFPGFETVQDPQLGQRIVKRQAPKVLMFDIRSRSEWEQGHIKGADAVCVEPAILWSGMNVDAMSEALQSNPSNEQEYFRARNSYDLIVLCDREGRGVAGPLEIIYRAISQDEARKSPSHSPVFLVGGVDRWSHKVGEQGMQRKSSSASDDTGSSSSGHTARQAGVPAQNGDAKTKRQGMYMGSAPPAALTPGGGTGASGRNSTLGYSTSSFNLLDSPSMPARAYQATSTAGPAGLPSTSLNRQSHIPMYSNSSGLGAPAGAASASTGASFDYPQLAASQTLRSSYGNSTLSGLAGAPTPPPAAANGTLVRSPQYEMPRPPLDVARRPTVPPPGGAPVSTTARQYSRFVPRVETNVRVGLTGLKNVGNSCYMNSTLQCLSATIPIARFLLDGSYKRAINRVNPLGTQGALAEAFAQLIRVLWSEQYTFVSPVTFREAITRFAPSFRGYDQHDAQEFLAFLLDGLHEDLNYVKQKPAPVEMTPEREHELEALPQQVASVKEWAIYRERNDSLIVDWFQGQFRNKLTCLTCGKTSTTYNAFLYLSLPIPPLPRGSGNKVTLAQCLDAFTRDEILDKADAWHCPRCNKPRRATKKLTISRLPQVLLIHLKRFSFKGPFTDKIETNVTFPTSNLDLTNYMPPPLPPGAVPKGMPVSASQQPPYVYDLYGATHHFGSLSGGHYTATIRTQGENGETQWKYCDDSRIANSDERQIHSPSSYILWWHRKGR